MLKYENIVTHALFYTLAKNLWFYILKSDEQPEIWETVFSALLLLYRVATLWLIYLVKNRNFLVFLFWCLSALLLV